MSWLSNLFKRNKPSPRDIIPREDIRYNKLRGEVVIKGVGDAWIADVAATRSMDPAVDYGHNCILTKTFKHEELEVGDIIAYTAPQGYILHRIIKIDRDNTGKRYYRVRGDNNFFADPVVLADENIEYLLVAIIY